MGQVLVDSNSLTAIAEAIRSKNKQTVKYKPNEMAEAIKILKMSIMSKVMTLGGLLLTNRNTKL